MILLIRKVCLENKKCFKKLVEVRRETTDCRGRPADRFFEGLEKIFGIIQEDVGVSELYLADADNIVQELPILIVIFSFHKNMNGKLTGILNQK